MKLPWPNSFISSFPMVFAPSINVIVPVGTGPVPVTVAVKVTGWPYVCGLAEVINAVLDGTVSETRTYSVPVVPWKWTLSILAAPEPGAPQVPVVSVTPPITRNWTLSEPVKARFSTELLLIVTLSNVVNDVPSSTFCGLEPLKVTVCEPLDAKLPLLLQSPATLQLFVPASSVVPVPMVSSPARLVAPAWRVLVPLPLVVRLP